MPNIESLEAFNDLLVWNGKRGGDSEELNFINTYCQYTLKNGLHIHNCFVNFILSCTQCLEMFSEMIRSSHGK